MKLLDRWNKIEELLNQKDMISVEEFVEKLGVSEATVRRDLDTMEKDGRLKRFRGGASRISNQESYEPAFHSDKRLNIQKNEKIEIAKIAASMIKDGDHIFMDSSTTVYYMIDYITAKNITVITNAFASIEKLLSKGIKTYVLSGFADYNSNSIIADDINGIINDMNFDCSFIGTYGIDVNRGYSTYDTRDGLYKKTILSHSQRAFVLADATKFEKNAFYTFASPEDCVLITNASREQTGMMANVRYTEE